MKQYISPDKSKTFKSKRRATQKLINEVLAILESFGIPMNDTPRRLERMAIAFMACADLDRSGDFERIKDLDDNYSLTTREVIKYVTHHFREKISSGSKDDIRRKDLKLLIVAGIILKSNPNSATNDRTRGYAVNPLYANLIRKYGSPHWTKTVKKELHDIQPLVEKLKRSRNLPKIPVALPSGKVISLSRGEHNDLQKSIVEEFLPRFGFEAEVLYLGDTSDKYVHLNKEKLTELKFFEISHEELPDIIAFSKRKNWIYLIEAVHSSGPISEIRFLELKKLTAKCKVDIVYVTAFLNRNTFRKFMIDIAWETEVWIADNPDHLVHFNGDKFLGPYH